MKRIVASIVFISSFFLSSAGQTAADAEAIKNIQWATKSVANGIVLKTCETERFFNSLQSIAILEIDTAIAQVDFKIDYDKSEYHPVSVFGRRNKAIAAINGTYFMTSGLSWHFLKIDGVSVASTVENEFSTRATGVFTVTDGLVDISTWNREKEAVSAGDAQYAVVCGPLVLDDDTDVEMWDNDFVTLRHPRSCVANTADGKVLIIAIDGRQSNRANGMNLYEMRFFVRQLGCIDALNLDGGGSTALYVAGEPNYGIVNKPIDENVPGKERNVGNILYITERDGSRPYSATDKSPGGVPELRMWIKADGDVTKDAAGKLIAPYVFDYTGYNDFNYANSGQDAAIRWNDDKVNAYPALSFDSASVLKSDRKVQYSTFYSVNTLNRNGTLLGFDEPGSHHPKYRYFLMANKENVYVHDGSNTTGGVNYAFIPYQDTFESEYAIYSSAYGKKHDTFVLNGEEQLTEKTNFCTRENINAYLQVGARNSYPLVTDPTENDYFYRGQVAEIIAYKDTLSVSEHVRVESYLAMKYGVTIAEPEYRYTASYGTRWWDGRNANYKPYNNYITFIGRDDTSDLHQLRGKSIGNHLLPKEGCLLSLMHGQQMIDNNQYFVCAGSSLEDLGLTTELKAENSNWLVMQRNWKFNTSASPSETFDVEVDIPMVHKAVVEDGHVGALIKSGDTYSYHSGTLNAEQSKLFVSGLTVKKADVMYLVLNDRGDTSVEGIAVESDYRIRYNSANKQLHVNSLSDLTYTIHIYSTSGDLMITEPNRMGEAQVAMESFVRGVYFITIESNQQTIVKREKLVVQ